MSDALSTSDIKKRSLKGAKWLIVTNAFGMPAAYLIALLLGRTGPEALGAYSLAQIFISVVITFTLFGGPAVLRNFLPKISGAEQRSHFAFSYGLILTGLMLVTLTLFYFSPGLLEFLLRREFDHNSYVWFVLLTIVAVTSECLMGIAAGLMQIKLAAISRLMVRIVILPLVGGFFLLDRLFLLEHTTEIILSGFLIAYTIGAILCIVGIWCDSRFRFRIGWYFPSGFRAFAFTSTAAMLFTFLYRNFDRICVLEISDLKGLGMYQAVLSLVVLIEVIPRMISTALVPMFSSLLESKEKKAILRAYNILQCAGVTSMFFAAIGIIAFSAELLSLFGTGYSEYDYLLAIFCVQAVLTSLFLGNAPILISYEKNMLRFIVSCSQIFLQVLLTFLLLDSYGVYAIACSKVVAVILAQGISTWYVTCVLQEGFQIPRVYWVGVVITIVVSWRTVLPSTELWISLLVFILSSGIFLLMTSSALKDCYCALTGSAVLAKEKNKG